MKSRYFFACIILSFAVLLAEVLPATAQDLTTLNWEFSSQGLPVTLSPPRSINITALVSQPNRFAPTTSLFAGTGGAGVYRSIDSGRTWAAVNSGLTALTVNTLFVDDFSLYAGTTNGLFRTIDGGQSWTRVPVSIGTFGATFITAGAVGSFDNRKVLFVGSSNGVFRSVDDGATWEYYNRGMSSTQFITTLLFFNRRVFAGTPNEGVYYISPDSTNASWIQPFQGLSPLSVTSFTTVSNVRIFAGTNGAGVFQSTDIGPTWNPFSTQLDNPTVTAMATFGDRIYAATSIGVYATANLGRFWTNVNTGFPIRAAGTLLPFAGQLFAAAGPNILRGAVFQSPPPVIVQIAPSSTPSRQFGADSIVTLNGRDFNDPLVSFAGLGLRRISWTPNSVVVALPVSVLTSDGVKTFTLQNQDGQRTTALFTVSGAVAPFISRIAPDSVTVGDPDFNLQIIGRTFFNNTASPSSSATATLAGVPIDIQERIGDVAILGRVPAVAVSVAGRKFIRVTNPNGQFFDYPFRVRAFPPAITDLDPPRVSVGNSDFLLTINGRNYFTSANVEAPNLAPLTVRLAGVVLRVVENTTSARVIVSVPATLVTSQATLTLRLTNDDGQFAETSLSVVPFSLSPITTPQTTICPGVTTPLTANISSGVPPYKVEWSPRVDSSSIDANGIIRAFISPTQPTRYTLTVTDRDGAGVPLTQSLQIGILQPQASAPAAVVFDTVNTFFRLTTTQTIRFTNTSPDGTTLTLGTPRSTSGAFRFISGIGASVQAGQALDLQVVFEPKRDGLTTDTLLIAFGPCDRFVSVVVSGVRVTPVLLAPVLLPVATQPDGRVPSGAATPLSWLPSAFLSVPSQYTIQIARFDNTFTEQNGFAAPLFTTTISQATTVQPAFTLQPNTAYAWAVRAANSVTSSTWAIPFYFITPPATAQRLVLDPTRVEFGDVVLNDSERRGLQTRLSAQQTTSQEIIGSEVFPASGAPRSAFALGLPFSRSTVTATSPASYIATFSPRDTALHQGVIRFRSASGDTLYALLSGRGTLCVPANVQAPCADTEIGLRFAPFKNNIPRPEIGDTVTVQLVMRRSSGLESAFYAARAQNFNADIWIANANVLFPRSVSQPTNLTDQQRTITPNRIRLRNIPVPRGNRTSDVVLAEFKAQALLTDTTATAIRLAEFTWNDAGQGAATNGANIRRILIDTAISIETYGRIIRPRSTAVLSALSITPNPATDVVEAIVTVQSAVDDIELSIVSSMGLTMQTQKSALHEAGTYGISLNTKNLPTGAYMLVVRVRDEIVSRQLLILGQ
ncbi:MAG: hypothetical protein H9535_10135 [Ignavibacteria bacterium]|nr:hypothetical protein [Ignavibacteria bacterium]